MSSSMLMAHSTGHLLGVFCQYANSNSVLNTNPILLNIKYIAFKYFKECILIFLYLLLSSVLRFWTVRTVIIRVFVELLLQA